MDDMFGPRIAGIFAQEATRNLSQDELAQLCEFLNAPKAGWSQTREQLNQKLTERLEDFYSTEVQVSGQARDRLASPGGPRMPIWGLYCTFKARRMLLVIFGILEVQQSDYSRRRESGTSSLSDMTGIGEQKKHSMAGLPVL